LLHACKQKSRTLATPWRAPERLPRSAERPGRRAPRLEGELQVVDLAQLVVHLEEGLDDRLDLLGHAVELLERDPLEFSANLLVEIQQAPEPAPPGEPAVPLV